MPGYRDPYGNQFMSRSAYEQAYRDLQQQQQYQANQYQKEMLRRGMQLQSLTPPPATKKPMEPPKHLVGAKVTVRTGKTIWTVVKTTFDQSSYKSVHLYYLEDDSGRQTREEEGDLKPVAGTANAGKAKIDFDTVVIAPEKREQILQALEQINQADLIFEKWGFSETIEKGRGVSMLFYGPPGTGKTLMAQAIANKLGYVLKVISTADIESSAPGEAERNIRKHFKEAKDGKTMLLFDECDSLIYTRANVGPILSAQINELLSQIERFDGITLFTTNRLGTLDEAVNRRLALKLEFAMPTVEERIEIWKRMFPSKAPVSSDVDWKKLATIEMSGGYIKNAVLRAARMAAIQAIPDDEKEIKMEHLRKALKLEAQSMLEFQQATAEQQGEIGRVGPGGKVDMRREVVRG